jgi:hypothetical protein
MRRTHFSPGTQKKKGPAGGLVSGSRMVCGGQEVRQIYGHFIFYKIKTNTWLFRLGTVCSIMCSSVWEASVGERICVPSSFFGCRPYCKKFVPLLAFDQVRTFVRPKDAALPKAAGRNGDQRISSRSVVRADNRTASSKSDPPALTAGPPI